MKRKTLAPETTAVFVHVFGTLDHEGQSVLPMNRGSIGTGNCVHVGVEVAATLHRTLKRAEAYRKLTGGLVIPTTVDKLKGMFPGSGGTMVITSKDARDLFYQASQQDFHPVYTVVPHKDTETGIELTDKRDWEWFNLIGEAIGTSI